MTTGVEHTDDRTTPGGPPGDPDLDALVDRVPVGWTAVTYCGRRWGMRRTDHAGGRTVAIAAEDLGGSGWVSTNVLRLSAGPVLKPCEMPAADVLEFLRGWTGPPAPEAVSTAAEGTSQERGRPSGATTP